MPVNFSEYNELKEAILRDDQEVLHNLRRKNPSITLDTIVCIKSQENLKQVRRNYPQQHRADKVDAYLFEYESGKSMIQISKEYDIPPCHLARIVLEQLAKINRKNISQILKNPNLISEATFVVRSPLGSELKQISSHRIRNDIIQCNDADTNSSPNLEIIRHTTGLECELLLHKKLIDANIYFQTESTLRDLGFSKTPDAKLLVPVCVRNRLVNWIDSKASFGDECTHKLQMKEQYQQYINRFGPGLVIYWFGYIAELNDHPEVLIMEDFPPDREILKLETLND